ncbi:MAG: nicotinate-nucleotide--dimethylbenzimidazole phosphoribosyltransferase [Anaerovoracaceae bacterium]
MKENLLKNILENIDGADNDALTKAKVRQDELIKPPESLGKLEEISIKMAGITSKIKNKIDKRCVIVLSADNGVVSEGVASAPQIVTISQTINFTKRITGVGALAKTFNCDLCVVDMGINNTVPTELLSKDAKDFVNNKIIDRKIRFGTSNLAKEPAMSREEAVSAILTGIEMVDTAKELGFDIIGVGEMGIGNTTTSSALLTAITKCPVEDAVGRGGGLTDQGLLKKKAIVNEVGLNRDYEDEIDALAKVGGFDIAAMVGVYIGAAKNRMPVVIDGYISAVAAMIASKLQPLTQDFMFGSHCSLEPGYLIAMGEMNVMPMLDLNMRLGEGTGCVLAFEIIKGALGVMNEMATFAEGEINDEYLDEIREGKCY